MLVSPQPPQAPDRLGCILVIDDEQDVIDMVSIYFGGSGYEMIGALQAGDGLMLADIHRPNLVLLDITMPGIDGIEVLQQLRVRWPELPIIMLTAVADVEIAKGALQRGAFDYVAKPFEWEHLERVVAAALTAKPVR